MVSRLSIKYISESYNSRWIIRLMCFNLSRCSSRFFSRPTVVPNIYIVNDIESDINLFADDTSLIKTVENPIVTSEVLQSDIEKTQLWADKWLVKFNPSKSESLIISRKRNKPTHPILTMSYV